MQFLRAIFSSKSVAPDARLDELTYVVFDTEFTSLEKRDNRLLSIGAVKMKGASIRVGEQFYRVTNPGIEVPGKSVLVHTLRSDDLGSEPPQVVAADFLSFCGNAVLVGHFVQYDVNIVRKELGKAGAGWNPANVDTARVHRWLELHRQHYSAEAFDERTLRLDLASAAEYYAVDLDNAHHALADAFVTAQVWQRQLAALSRKGVESWRKLQQIQR